MAYQAVIFDLDGTLINTLQDLTQATNNVLAARGFDTYSTDEVRCMVGNGTRRLLELAAPKASPSSLIDELVREYLPEYFRLCCDKSYPYPGIVELLKKLKEHGVRLGVVSNKPDACVQKVMNHYLGGLCEFLLGAQDKLPRKPNPDGVLLALEALGTTNKKDALYVGDSEVDVLCARNAGLDCAIVSWGFRDVDAFCDENVFLAQNCQALESLILGTDR